MPKIACGEPMLKEINVRPSSHARFVKNSYLKLRASDRLRRNNLDSLAVSKVRGRPGRSVRRCALTENGFTTALS